jgi:hypothetical protein
METKWYHYLYAFVAGALFINVVPHFVNGISGTPFPSQQFFVDALRRAGALTISQVAKVDGEIIGLVAISPVTFLNGATDWFGLGPISVLPEF